MLEVIMDKKPTFDANYLYRKSSEGPIGVNAVLTLNPTSGDVEDEWGTDQFYLPHGIHIDALGNFWLTDVALHQIFKFPRRMNPSLDTHEPSLVLGERFVPGYDAMHFCQPTSVVTMPGDGGEIIVADGYCNERIVIFDREGRPLAQLPPRGNENFLRLRVPHSLTILKRGDLCVADREHQRIVCFNLTRALESVESRDRASSYLPLAIHRPGVCKIFGIASHDDMLYAINGPTTPNNPVMGFTISPDQGSVLSTWSPTYETFTNPHSIATSANGTTLYVSEIGPNVVWKFRLISNWKM
ncbi:hypothetical protein QAD02_005008 [Eretmocerus hayati]|uniref:Uncharacterized protein n=1 Tax=Eretmocerus hayati TaxID=131215 RepID=A0ACC2NRI4_9HYME|nr:hypothetical protein QAD02_005008 [Eretmocerus hayati]